MSRRLQTVYYSSEHLCSGARIRLRRIRDSWQAFKLESVDDYNHNTKIYHFTFGEGNEDKGRGGDIPNLLMVKTPEGEGEVKDAKGKPVARYVFIHG